MTLCFAPTASIRLEREPACLRVRWFDSEMPLFCFSPHGSVRDERVISLPPVYSLQIDIAQRVMLIIFVANDNQ